MAVLKSSAEREAHPSEEKGNNSSGVTVKGSFASGGPVAFGPPVDAQPELDRIGCVPVDDLDCAFQSIVDLATEELFAREVLARCVTPGLKHPEVLFDRAAVEGFAGLLGRRLRLLSLPQCRGLPVFVNIHPAELGDIWITDPADPLYTHDRDVYLEITEAVPFTHYELCCRVLRDIKARGRIHIVVDDFGSGYSNIKRIADLEPAIVKLDQDLVRDLHLSRRRRSLVQAVVRMCVDLGAEVVAEGLECREEVEAVLEAGVHYGQGFQLGRPTNPPDAPW